MSWYEFSQSHNPMNNASMDVRNDFIVRQMYILYVICFIRMKNDPRSCERDCINCVHNCEDHSSFDFISVVLI